MSNEPHAHADRELLLGKIKDQYEPGPMRPRLYEVFKAAGQTLPKPSYEWMYYAGMGDVDFFKTSEEESLATQELLEEGRIVPTFEEDFYYGHKTIRALKHFDDVKFGLDEHENIIIYDFMASEGRPDPVIRPDKSHDAAIAWLKGRIDFPTQSHAVVVDDSPIQLRGGPVVRPILTDKSLIELRHRQRDFTPSIV